MSEDANEPVSVLHLAGSKLRSRLSSHWNESASAATSSFAKKQLEKMGWTEGTGLGKRRTGISSHIKVKRRADEQSGLGNSKSSVLSNGDAATLAVHTDDWWKSSVGNTLAKLSSKSKKKKKKSSTKKRKREYTDEELFEATGGARFGMRAQAPQRGKWQRTESSDETMDEIAKKRLKLDVKGSGTTLTTDETTEDDSKKMNAKGVDLEADDDSCENTTAKKKNKKERKEAKKKKKEEKRRSKKKKDKKQ